MFHTKNVYATLEHFVDHCYYHLIMTSLINGELCGWSGQSLNTFVTHFSLTLVQA